MADVKVEEVDLDSDSDIDDDTMGGNETFRFQAKDAGAVSNGKKDQSGGEDNSNQPSLTLQSFARIPALATQDIIPSFNQNSSQDVLTTNDDRHAPHETSMLKITQNYTCI